MLALLWRGLQKGLEAAALPPLPPPPSSRLPKSPEAGCALGAAPSSLRTVCAPGGSH